MNIFRARVLSREEIAEICSQDSIVSVPDPAHNPDEWLKLERHFKRPVAGVHRIYDEKEPDSISSDFIVLCTNGHMDFGTPTIKGNLEYVKKCLLYISKEREISPIELCRSHYYIEATKSSGESIEDYDLRRKLKKWLCEKYNCEWTPGKTLYESGPEWKEKPMYQIQVYTGSDGKVVCIERVNPVNKPAKRLDHDAFPKSDNADTTCRWTPEHRWWDWEYGKEKVPPRPEERGFYELMVELRGNEMRYTRHVLSCRQMSNEEVKELVQKQKKARNRTKGDS